MSSDRENRITLTWKETKALYRFLHRHESRLDPDLTGLFNKTRTEVYRQLSIEELEELIAQGSDEGGG